MYMCIYIYIYEFAVEGDVGDMGAKFMGAAAVVNY